MNFTIERVNDYTVVNEFTFQGEKQRMQLILEPREYQQELFAQAVEQNTMIVLPTGLGKTALIAYLSFYHWREDDSQKILMATPTKPLVFQSANMLREYLNLSEDEIAAVTGEIIPKKREKLYENATIVVGTPQTLSNDLLFNRLDLKAFSFLAFDEAHRATGNYAYVKIINLAEDLGLLKKLHIVGFTATPGNSKEQILQILKNLKISKVIMKSSSDPDVRKYSSIHEPVVEWINLPEPYLESIKLLNKLKKNLVEKLKETGIDVDSRYLNKRRVIELQNVAFKKAKEEDEYGKVLFITPNLIRILHLIEMIETQGMLQAKQTLDNWIAKEGKKHTLREFLELPEIINLKSIMVKALEIHPKIPTLQKILKKHFLEQKGSKVIVFTNYRKTAKLLSSELNGINLTNKVFVGKTTSAGDGIVMSQKQQIEVLEEFKTGDLDILIATSVGEEGLDVGSCDLVIFFDSVPSVVRSIQREGRGRKKQSKVIRLITKGTKDAGMYYAVKKKEKFMENFIKRELPSILTDLNQEMAPKKHSLLNYVNDKVKTKETDLTVENGSERSKKGANGEISPNGADGDKRKEALFQPGTTVVIVDSREAESIVPRILRKEGAKIIPRVLSIGDYQVSEKCIIERKTSEDFVNSLLDGRLFQQVATKLVNYDKPVMIIEGDWDLVTKQVKTASINGALASILLDFRIPVLMSPNAVETARYIIAFAKREQRERKKTDPLYAVDQGDLLVPDIQKMVLASIPGINRGKAENILLETRNLRSVANMDEKDLAKIPGVGKILSKRIEKIFKEKYVGN